MTAPPPQVLDVCEGLLFLLAGMSSAIDVDARGRPADTSWQACKRLLGSARLAELLRDCKTRAEGGTFPAQNMRAVQRLPLSSSSTQQLEDLAKTCPAAHDVCLFLQAIA